VTAPTVRTVLGDVPASSLGFTLGHEHLFTRPPADVTDPDLRMDSEAAAIQEAGDFRAAGGGAIVEMTTVDYGRDAAALARISWASGVHVVAATGYNKGTFADRMTAGRSVAEIAALMAAEVRSGIEGGPVRAGLIKASSSLGGPNSEERKVLEAAVEAHHATGAPIGTHTEKGTWGLEQAEFFLAGGVPPGKVLIGHLDLKPDLSSLLEVAATGVNLGLDQFSKEKYLPDLERVRLVAALVEAGHGRQVIVGGDLARRSYWRAYGGGPGLGFIPGRVVPLMNEHGLGATAIHEIMVEAPRRWLAFEPH